jgi:hypothetical protein
MTGDRRRKIALRAPLIAAVLCLSATGAAATNPTPPTGNAAGLALLARVHKAYESVPAVINTVRVGAVKVRVTLLLREGTATAEENIENTPSGTGILVKWGQGPTYARDPGATCWRRLASTDAQALEDVGIRFPYANRMTVKAPTRAGGIWLLPVVFRGSSPGEVGAFTMRINAKTLLLQSQTGTAGGNNLTEQIQALAHQPPLPTPRPTC